VSGWSPALPRAPGDTQEHGLSDGGDGARDGDSVSSGTHGSSGSEIADSDADGSDASNAAALDAVSRTAGVLGRALYRWACPNCTNTNPIAPLTADMVEYTRALAGW
jgi:hypothetical protein